MKVPVEPPYRWYPVGTQSVPLPSLGQLIAWRHSVWRVVEINPVPEVDWTDAEGKRMAAYLPQFRTQYAPYHVIVRPVAITGDDPRARDRDVHLRRTAGGSRAFDVYPNEHYPVCSQCQEPVPCREEMARKGAEDGMRKMNRYAMSGVCPACEEPITSRQRALITFDENLELPGGPPVTYHLRQGCKGAAINYEKRWAAADPDHRRTTLSCPGKVCRHTDGIECSEDPMCPGHKLPHGSVTACNPAYGGGCERCADGVKLRNMAGDWTVWT